VVDVRNDYRAYQEAGAEVAVVTMGAPPAVAAFRALHQLPFPTLADPEKKAYRAYGVGRGTLWQIAGPAVWLPSLRAIARAGVGKPVDDTFQMHGAFVIDSGGVIRYSFQPRSQADYPRRAALFDVLAKARAGE
jgi:peroxiredoxin